MSSGGVVGGGGMSGHRGVKLGTMTCIYSS